MNLKEKNFFDHHTHLLNPKTVTLTKKEYVMRFLHGFQDTEPWDKGPIPIILTAMLRRGRSRIWRTWAWSRS